MTMYHIKVYIHMYATEQLKKLLKSRFQSM
jgi:hypothetical protein